MDEFLAVAIGAIFLFALIAGAEFGYDRGLRRGYDDGWRDGFDDGRGSGT